MLPHFLSIVSFGLLILSGLVSFSIRSYSVSRLEGLCEKKNNDERFRHILKREFKAQIAWDVLFAISNVLLIYLLSYISIPMVEDSAASSWQRFSELCVLVATFTLLVVLSTIMTWAIARVVPEILLYKLWPTISVVTTLFKPVTLLAERLDHILHRVSGRDEPEAHDAGIVTDEIMSYIDEGQREGILEEGAGRMISRVIELADSTVGSIMTPRTDMKCLSADVTIEEARDELIKSGHSRMPVIGESTDDVKGVLYAKDLLKETAHPSQDGWDVLRILRKPFYVPETTGINTLLEILKRERVHIAIVLDEYGGISGLVTMEDILEEIVGEITDEYDEEEEQRIEELEEGIAVVDGRVHIDELNEKFDYGLSEDEDYDTIGGFVFARLGRIPKENESVTWNNLEVTVLEADARKVIKVQIRVLKGQPTLVEE
ncbi:hemolysin family protein [Lacunimicrobium album]